MKTKNIIAIILGILVIVGIIWIKQQYSPEKLTNIRDKSTWEEKTAKEPKIPTPIPSPTPILLSNVTSEKLEYLSNFLDQADANRREIEEVMIPAVKRLYQREKEEIFRWAEDANWPGAYYEGKFTEENKNMDFFLQGTPEEFLQFRAKLIELQDLALKAAHSFRHSPNSPKEISGDITSKIDRLLPEIKSELKRLRQKLEQEVQKRK